MSESVRRVCTEYVLSINYKHSDSVGPHLQSVSSSSMEARKRA